MAGKRTATVPKKNFVWPDFLLDTHRPGGTIALDKLWCKLQDSPRNWPRRRHSHFTCAMAYHPTGPFLFIVRRIMAKRKPKEFVINFYVRHPDSEIHPQGDKEFYGTDPDGNIHYPETDPDGHQITIDVSPAEGLAVAFVSFRRGIADDSATYILRKLADTIDTNPGTLSLPWGTEGRRSDSGEIEIQSDGLTYDDQGDVILPDAQ